MYMYRHIYNILWNNIFFVLCNFTWYDVVLTIPYCLVSYSTESSQCSDFPGPKLDEGHKALLLLVEPVDKRYKPVKAEFTRSLVGPAAFEILQKQAKDKREKMTDKTNKQLFDLIPKSLQDPLSN